MDIPYDCMSECVNVKLFYEATKSSNLLWYYYWLHIWRLWTQCTAILRWKLISMSTKYFRFHLHVIAWFKVINSGPRPGKSIWILIRKSRASIDMKSHTPCLSIRLTEINFCAGSSITEEVGRPAINLNVIYRNGRDSLCSVRECHCFQQHKTHF
jgi:hypothetical protein